MGLLKTVWCNHQYVTELHVDHHSLKAQKEEAEQNGDSSLVRLFSRVPERYVSVISCQDYEEPRLERLKIFRGLRERHFDLVMKLDASTKETDELEVKDDIQFVSSRIKALIKSKEYSEQKFLNPLLADLKNKMLTAVAQVNKWKRSIISQHDAEEQAKLEYMTKSERKLWLKFFETLTQKKHLELFWQTLKKPDESDKEATRAFAQIASGVKTQIADLDTSLTSMKKPVEDIRRRLELPNCRNNILMVTHQILQDNTHARQTPKRTNIELNKAIDDLRNVLFAQSLEEPQTTFKTREVYNLICRQYCALKKEHEVLLVGKFHIKRQIISPQLAIFMAKKYGDIKRKSNDSLLNYSFILRKKKSSKSETGRSSRALLFCKFNII